MPFRLVSFPWALVSESPPWLTINVIQKYTEVLLVARKEFSLEVNAD
jgi:hypothetical protein